MLVQAGLEGRTPAEIANAYEAAFHADEAAVNILPAHVFPRATEHIAEMVRLAEALQDAGHAYATAEGNVYYDVASFPGYGRLSGNTLADLRAGHRGEVEPDKRDPADFALWKAAGEGRLLKWPTPRWGEGFPGWHLECSAMSMRYLGSALRHPHRRDRQRLPPPRGRDRPVDADRRRGAGAPLGPRRVPADGRPEDVQVGRATSSASRSSSDRGLDPLAFRYLTLTSRYERKLGYSDRSLGAAAAALASLRTRLRALGPPPPGGPGRPRRRSWPGPPATDPRASRPGRPATVTVPGS